MGAKCKPIGEAFQIVCDVCLIQFIVPADFREQKIARSEPFYCPNGHQLIYERRETKNNGN